MKKIAMTVAEVVIAMSILVGISVLAINTLRSFINKDTDIARFKHVYATISEVVYSLKTDACAYPLSTGFADTSVHFSCMNTKSNYTTNTKFKTLFTSKFNVFENNINLDLSKQYIPLFKYKKSSQDGYTTISNKLSCFVDNKGFMLCPPETDVSSGKKISSIFIPVFVNKIDLADSSTFGLKKMIFIEVKSNGNIDIPLIVEYYDGNKINNKTKKRIVVDCTNKAYNKYNHCKILDKMMSVEF